MGRFKDAETVFRAELVRHKNNGRALFGLSESLKRQGKSNETNDAERLFVTSWARSDFSFSLDEL
jgi:hypothetical protein